MPALPLISRRGLERVHGLIQLFDYSHAEVNQRWVSHLVYANLLVVNLLVNLLLQDRELALKFLQLFIVFQRMCL